MEKILFFGDSVTDANRNRDGHEFFDSYGSGYVIQAAGELLLEPGKYQIINNGISGNRIVDLYARIKTDVWNLNPDVLSILIGINDIWHEINYKNGVDIERFENIYRLMIKETKEKLPNTRIILVEPFVLHGTGTDAIFDELNKVREYAIVTKKIAKEFHLEFVPLQDRLDSLAPVYGEKALLIDGIHPNVLGSKIIAQEWLKQFKKNNLE